MDQIKILIDCEFERTNELLDGIPCIKEQLNGKLSLKEFIDNLLTVHPSVKRVRMCAPDEFSTSDYRDFYKHIDISLGELIIEALSVVNNDMRFMPAVNAAIDTLHSEIHGYLYDLGTYNRLKNKLEEAEKSIVLSEKELELVKKIFSER